MRVNDTGEYDPKGKYIANRRIIVGTNVAETGITISTLGHCIDLGWKNVAEIYNPFGILGLLIKPVDRHNVIQRRGRVGRKFPGFFYTIYTEETFNSLNPVQLPSVIVEDISSYIIDIIFQQKDCFSISRLDMLDVPPVDSLRYAIEKNICLGYLLSDYGKCYLISSLGEKFKDVETCSLEGFRFIIAGFSYGICVKDLITIYAMNESRLRMRKVKIKEILKQSLPAFFFENAEKYMETYDLLTLDTFVTDLFIFESFMQNNT